MKHTLLYIAAAAVGASAMVSCDNDFEYPPVVLPSVAQVTPTTTLPQLKAEYWSTVQGTPATLPYLENGDTIIFTGRVCSSDETGNIFKNIVIQSKDEKGRQVALTFSVNSYDLYQQLPFGQEVAVMASGLSVGGYNGLMQFGSISGSSMSFMDPDVFSTHVVRTGSPLPAPALVDTTATTAAKLVEVKNDADSLMLWQSRLIRLENVSFVDAGQPFAGAQTSDRYVVDAEGNRINVRNSSYSDFKSEILPYGVGSVTGILSYYRNDWQISLIDAAGLQDFDNIEPEPEPVVAEPTLVASFDDGKIPEGWSNIKLAGNKEWYIASFNSEFYAAMTGYKGTPPFDSWLITAPVDLDKSTKKVMSFKTQVNGYGSTTTDLSVFVMTDPDPSKTEYTEIEFTKAAAVASGYSGWVESGEIDLSEFSGIIYVGFRYTATTDENYATWCVDNIVIGKEAETGPDTPDTPAAGTIYSGLAASNTEMPADWKAENVELGGLDYVWSWKTYNNAGYLNASAFKDGAAVASTAYMVSPEIDLTGATGCTLSFEHAAKFQTTLKDLCGIVAREKGADTWTDLTIPTWPEAGSWTFVSSGNVDLSAFDGKVIEVAFRYGSSTAGADTWEIKNLTVNGKK